MKVYFSAAQVFDHHLSRETTFQYPNIPSYLALVYDIMCLGSISFLFIIFILPSVFVLESVYFIPSFIQRPGKGCSSQHISESDSDYFFQRDKQKKDDKQTEEGDKEKSSESCAADPDYVTDMELLGVAGNINLT